MVAVVLTSLIALVQHDMKKLIAYSSVAHMAIVTVGLFAFNVQGLEGAMIVMLSHGLVSGALFLCVGVIYDRLHTREIDRYGGLCDQHAANTRCSSCCSRWPASACRAPAASSASSSASPASTRSPAWVALVCTTGIILGAAYMLYLYRRVAFGVQRNADAAAMPDLDVREWLMLGPIAAGGAVDGRLSGKLPRADARRTSPRSTRGSRRARSRQGDRAAARSASQPHAAAEHAAAQRGGSALMDFRNSLGLIAPEDPALVVRPGPAAGRRLGRATRPAG